MLISGQEAEQSLTITQPKCGKDAISIGLHMQNHIVSRIQTRPAIFKVYNRILTVTLRYTVNTLVSYLAKRLSPESPPSVCYVDKAHGLRHARAVSVFIFLRFSGNVPIDTHHKFTKLCQKT